VFVGTPFEVEFFIEYVDGVSVGTSAIDRNPHIAGNIPHGYIPANLYIPENINAPLRSSLASPVQHFSHDNFDTTNSLSMPDLIILGSILAIFTALIIAILTTNIKEKRKESIDTYHQDSWAKNPKLYKDMDFALVNNDHETTEHRDTKQN
jgi:hypothetical protein